MNRLTSVDICRGIAITCMVAADIPVITNVGSINFFAGMLAAPFFIFIAGVSYELFVISRIEKLKQILSINIETIWRGVILLGVTQIIFFIGVLLFPSRFSFGFNSSVFLVIAVGYFLSVFVPRKCTYQIPLIILPFIILYYNDSIPGMLSFLFSAPFPLIPFIAYFFVGRGIIIFFENINDLEMKNSKIIIFSSLFVIILAIIFKITSRINFLGFLFLVGVMLCILSFFGRVSGTKKYDFFLSPFEGIGRIAFSLYYVFFGLELIVFPYLNRVLIINFDPEIQIIIYYMSIIIIILIFSSIEKTWRKFDYKFGFEWIMRRGSTYLTNLTLKFF